MFAYPCNVAAGESGYRVTFHLNERNVFPGCGRSHWLVGRMTAECAFCATALPLDGGGSFGTGLFTTRGRPALAPALPN